MRVLLVGAGGVGTAITRIAARRSFFDHMVVTDYDLSRAEAAVAALGEGKPDSPLCASTPPTGRRSPRSSPSSGATSS